MTPDIERAVSVMRGFPGPWGIAGGWALDLAVGRQSRPHADIDIAILRENQHDLRSRLRGGRVEKVVEHQLIEWPPNETLEQPIHEVHVAWPDGAHLEFLLNERDPRTGDWLFRRDVRVRRSIEAAFPTEQRIPHLAPEIVLLYKSKAPSAKDDADFEMSIPHLTGEQRSWLRQALDTTMPGHHWARILCQEIE